MDIIDKDKIKENFLFYARRFRNVDFPLKTNSSEKVIYELSNIGDESNYGIGFLVSNFNQIPKVMRHKDKKNITMINTLSSVMDYIDYFRLGVRKFVFSEDAKLCQFLNALSLTEVEQLKIVIKADLSSVTGINTNTTANISEFEYMIDTAVYYNLNIGVSAYIPNEVQKDINVIKDVLKYIKSELMVYGVKSVHLGGISEIQSLEEEVQKDMWNQLQIFQSQLEFAGIKLVVEPGKGMMKNAANSLFDVMAVTSNAEGLAITINGTTYNEFWDAVAIGREFKIIEVNEKKIDDMVDARKKKLEIYGNSSDHADKIGIQQIPAHLLIKEGDFVLIKDTGYYFGRQ